MNKNQKIVLTISVIIIAIIITTWLLQGAEIFTKTQVLVDKKDELFGTTYKALEDKFVLGLDYAGAAAGIVAAAGGILIFTLRKKKETK